MFGPPSRTEAVALEASKFGFVVLEKAKAARCQRACPDLPRSFRGRFRTQMVPKAGVEPAPSCEDMVLKQVRSPGFRSAGKQPPLSTIFITWPEPCPVSFLPLPHEPCPEAGSPYPLSVRVILCWDDICCCSLCQDPSWSFGHLNAVLFRRSDQSIYAVPLAGSKRPT